MGWKLPDLYALDEDVFEALVKWINDTSSNASHDGGSIDMDAVIDAKKASSSE